ncbi:MAG: hypothetical protein Q9222_006768 [Ikaeria aurantiellina]
MACPGDYKKVSRGAFKVGWWTVHQPHKVTHTFTGASPDIFVLLSVPYYSEIIEEMSASIIEQWFTFEVGTKSLKTLQKGSEEAHALRTHLSNLVELIESRSDSILKIPVPQEEGKNDAPDSATLSMTCSRTRIHKGWVALGSKMENLEDSLDFIVQHIKESICCLFSDSEDSDDEAEFDTTGFEMSTDMTWGEYFDIVDGMVVESAEKSGGSGEGSDGHESE